MTMPNFDALAEMPGVTFKKFCSFSCTNEATGELEIFLDEQDVLKVPVCSECATAALDKVERDMLD